VEGENFSPLMSDDEEAIQDPEGTGRHGEDRARENLEEGESKVRR
jgi:hypothetical protein